MLGLPGKAIRKPRAALAYIQYKLGDLWIAVHNAFLRTPVRAPHSDLPELREIEQKAQIPTDISDHLPTLFVEALTAYPRLIVELDLSQQDLSALKWDSLHSLSELESLNLAHSTLSDEYLEELSRLPALRHLDLTGTAITDQGLKAIGRFWRLRFLSLRETRVTEDALADLSFSLPNLLVDADEFPRLDPVDSFKDVAYDARV